MNSVFWWKLYPYLGVLVKTILILLTPLYGMAWYFSYYVIRHLQRQNVAWCYSIHIQRYIAFERTVVHYKINWGYQKFDHWLQKPQGFYYCERCLGQRKCYKYIVSLKTISIPKQFILTDTSKPMKLQMSSINPQFQIKKWT